ncbi:MULTISPECIES: hydrogenase maturation protease [unclassified Streptomyces]|uniref:hydrogenase maturation protease n=1 Tax=unclassified Streptomyces TaxID=2593676 RepID=UPI000DBA24B5|nr:MULTISPECIES: hydrogenase maturation protease [unclassified Streptomyces]MYT75130.1 hydrogenase maturation protease [Streptomyces sp. SID8367]RAJ77087.1 hydrogenase maturation protease [Streptomyces sp. PsTaAH-137]
MAARAGRTRIAVIGVGNMLRRDEGVGWAAVALLEERARHRPLPPGTALAVCDGDPGRLIGLWEGAELAVVLDTAHTHPGRPGRVHRIALDAAHLNRPCAAGSHGLGLAGAVELARLLGRLPGRLVVYAVEGADHSLGTRMSPEVRASVAHLAAAVEDEIVRHRDAAAHR